MRSSERTLEERRTANPLASSELAQPSQSGQARHKEVLSAAEHVEGFDSVNATPDRFSRNGETRPFFLQSDNRISLFAEPHEIAVVDPLLLQEFDRGHGLRADEQEVGATRHLIRFFGQRIRIVWRSIRRPSPYHAMQVHVS